MVQATVMVPWRVREGCHDSDECGDQFAPSHPLPPSALLTIECLPHSEVLSLRPAPKTLSSLCFG